jgi:carboxyl-terminal processing protease
MIISATSSMVRIGMRALSLFFALTAMLLPAAAAQNPINETDVFREALRIVQAQYVDEPNLRTLVRTAVDGLLKAHPSERASALAKRLDDAGGAVDQQAAAFNQIYAAAKQDDNGKTDAAGLLGSALTPMLTSLDAHSVYLDAKTYQAMQAQNAGKFGGVGLEVTIKNGELRVVSAIDGTPAAKAGILADDFVQAIDGVLTAGGKLGDLVAKMRGAVGTPVTLTIVRRGIDAPFPVRLERAIITVQAVRQRLEGDLGYIRISVFNAQVTNELATAFAALQANGGADRIKGYILDLRNNSGGLLDQAVSAADDFLDSGEISSMRGRTSDKDQRFNAKLGDLANRKPVVVLVNHGTASGSEIIAGALQDHQRAVLIGARTFGEGTVQTIFPLGAWGALRLTTLRFYTPAGHGIEGTGIIPDVLVEAGDGKAGESPAEDRQLQAAIARLHGVPLPSVAAAPAPAPAPEAGKRVALVIGNSAYSAVGALPNPLHDAQAIATALKGDGFEVTTIDNVTRADFIAAINGFTDRAANADWAVIYYAGHGLQLDGVNYVVPIDAKLLADRDVQDEAIALDRVTAAVSGARKLGLVVVDACRNNPFLVKMRFTTTARAALTRGLARVATEGTTLVEFSARDGQEALDGDATGNSPFAAALAKRMATPGLEVGKLLREIREDVLAATENRQEPMFSGSLPADDMFFRLP